MLMIACLLMMPDLPIASITPTGYGDWTATGDAFRLGPATGRTIPELEIKHNRDVAVISSEREGDRPTGTLTSPDFTIDRSHISFRIGGGDYAGRTCVDLVVDGKVVRTATGHRSDTLAPENWYVATLRGAKARVVVVDRESGDWGHVNVDHIVQTNQPEKAIQDQPLYQEDLRPRFHVTARYWNDKRIGPVEHQEGWINDLNGLIYYDGEYHLFAQRWATCWLHFISKDLVHWKELEPAFFEESHGVGVQSGTCVVDYMNTSGLGSIEHPPMIAFWSRFDNRSQCFHFSLDHGRTWRPYAKNAFMVKPERDPKVFWYEPGRHWVMVMYGGGAYHILNSTNLLDWRDTGHPIPNSFECPDVFELPVDGDSKRTKWVVVQGSGAYSIGSFDGKEFKEDGPRLRCDVGPNFYATQTWANTETGDGRRIQAAWMRGSVFPNMPFSQQISFPCQLTLRTTPAGIRLFREPIAELQRLHASSQRSKTINLTPGQTKRLATKGDAFRVRCDVAIPSGSKLEFDIRGETLTIESRALSNGTAHAETIGPIESIEILVDRGSIEVFLNHGEVSSTRFALPEGQGVAVRAIGGPVELKTVEVNPLKSIW